MESKDSRHGDAAELRARAEKRAGENAAQFPENIEDLSSTEMRRILYELRVHQIELEMQNEELRQAQEELDTTRARYLHRKRLFATDEPQSFELRMVRLDGVEFWALLEAAAAGNDDGAPVFRVVMGDISTRKQAHDALQDAFDQIKTLRGIVPICMHCKNIRDDQGFWNKVEVYVRDQSEAEFSHSVCPKCAQEFYPDLTHTGERAPENEGGPQ